MDDDKLPYTAFAAAARRLRASFFACRFSQTSWGKAPLTFSMVSMAKINAYISPLNTSK